MVVALEHIIMAPFLLLILFLFIFIWLHTVRSMYVMIMLPISVSWFESPKHIDVFSEHSWRPFLKRNRNPVSRCGMKIILLPRRIANVAIIWPGVQARFMISMTTNAIVLLLSAPQNRHCDYISGNIVRQLTKIRIFLKYGEHLRK